MKISRPTTKTTRYLLANHNGIEIYLSVPSKDSKGKYYLDYKTTSQIKYYGNGSVRKRAIEFFDGVANSKLTHAQLEAELAQLFKKDIELIVHDIQVIPKATIISMRSSVTGAIEAFFDYKTLQSLEGVLEKRALTNYGQYHRKLLSYFKLEQFRRYTLNDLSSAFWVGYRIALLNNSYAISTKCLSNASVNQHFQYVTQFYGWLIDYLELPIKHHLKKQTKLNEAKQTKRFKIIPREMLNEFYSILEHREKHGFTSLYLAALLLYENNIRLSEQVLIQVQDIDLAGGMLTVVNKKNDSTRTVIISQKSKELIALIVDRTKSKGYAVAGETYLFGGYNRLKPGKPLSHDDLGTWMRRFRKFYPQFVGRTLYELKHTSITNQFNAGVDHHQIRERANHSSISTTEIYLQSSRVVQPYELGVTAKKYD
ncbi:integrase [Pedobacter sp. AK017]|uniref:tyrosine-type recombinase/integrase n=1 Tax=Pedobacter sp. AK017 TaxID=2723073 RepID=UPI0016176932|nr:site-specific integrase [Pedobacter sp. AK017]MBB5441039.1 integrase [Pedobacter sp. AK017]